MRFNSLVTLIATVVALIAISNGTARANVALGIEEESTASLAGRLTLSSEASNVICNVTLETPLAPADEKLEGVEIARITGVATSGCRTSVGTFRSLTMLGLAKEGNLWMVVYKAFLGTLPRPTGYRLQIQHLQALLETNPLIPASCLYEGSAEVLMGAETSGVLERLRSAGPSEVALVTTLAGICPSRASVALEVTPLHRTRVTLLRTVAVGGLKYRPEPLVVLEPRVERVNVELINKDIRPIESITVENERGVERRYQAVAGTCAGTLNPLGLGACTIEVERSEERKRGLGNVIVNYRVGWVIKLNSSLTVQIEGR